MSASVLETRWSQLELSRRAATWISSYSHIPECFPSRLKKVDSSAAPQLKWLLHVSDAPQRSLSKKMLCPNALGIYWNATPTPQATPRHRNRWVLLKLSTCFSQGAALLSTQWIQGSASHQVLFQNTVPAVEWNHCCGWNKKATTQMESCS